jgi:NAD(P)-dependent dehydrogenase (short-subunit alcohol dehydrogenase family)
MSIANNAGITGPSDKMLDGVTRAVLLRRIASPGEVADGVAWLLSARSSYVTGTAMPVDGGWTAQ